MELNRETAMAAVVARSVVSNTGCWLWTRHTINGYGYVKVNGKNIKANRLVAWVYYNLDLGDRLQLAMHTCDVKSCANPEHICVGTHSQNRQDAWDRGLHPRRYKPKEVCLYE